MKRKTNRLTLADFLAFGLFILILTIAISRLTFPQIQPELEISQAAKGVQEEQIPAQALLILSEYLITAPTAGEFTPKLAEGERVIFGQEIGYMTQPFFSRSQEAPIPVLTGKPGICSYKLDGLERVINAENMQNQDLGLLIGLDQPKNQEASASPWSPNRPLAKIIDPDGPFYLLLSFENSQGWQPIGNLWRFISEDGQVITGKAIAMGKRNQHQYTLLQLNTPPPLTGSRYCTGYIITGSQE